MDFRHLGWNIIWHYARFHLCCCCWFWLLRHRQHLYLVVLCISFLNVPALHKYLLWPLKLWHILDIFPYKSTKKFREKTQSTECTPKKRVPRRWARACARPSKARNITNRRKLNKYFVCISGFSFLHLFFNAQLLKNIYLCILYTKCVFHEMIMRACDGINKQYSKNTALNETKWMGQKRDWSRKFIYSNT